MSEEGGQEAGQGGEQQGGGGAGAGKEEGLTFSIKPRFDGGVKRVRLKDIAEKLGVSVTTVSLALKGHQRISQKRREEIEKVAQKMGYQEDPRLQSLVAYRDAERGRLVPEGIMYLCSGITREQWKVLPNLKVIAEAATSHAQRKGVEFQFRMVEEHGIEEVLGELRQKSIKGVLLHDVNGGLWRDFPLEEFAVVGVMGEPLIPGLYHVSNDYFTDMKFLMRDLYDRGYRRPGLWLRQRWRVNQVMVRGCFLAESESIGMKLSKQSLHVAANDEEGWGSLKGWVEKGKFDVVLGCAGGNLRKCLQAAGVSCPEEVAAVDLSCSTKDTDVSGFYVRRDLIVREAVERLLQQLYFKKFGKLEEASHSYVRHEWMEGKTLPLVKG